MVMDWVLKKNKEIKGMLADSAVIIPLIMSQLLKSRGKQLSLRSKDSTQCSQASLFHNQLLTTPCRSHR